MGKNTQGTQGKGAQPQVTQATCTPNKKQISKLTISFTQTWHAGRGDGHVGIEDEESPCHKQVIMVQADVEADLNDAVSDFDFSLLSLPRRSTPSVARPLLASPHSKSSPS